MTQSSSRKVEFGPLQITASYNNNRKDGAISYQIEQTVTVSYEGAKSSFSKLQNFNKLTGRDSVKQFSKRRIFFLDSLLSQATLQALLDSQEFRNARIIYRYDNSPILEPGDLRAIERDKAENPDSDLYERIVDNQLLRDSAKNPILDAYGNLIYRKVILGDHTQTDELNGVVFAGSQEAAELITTDDK